VPIPIAEEDRKNSSWWDIPRMKITMQSVILKRGRVKRAFPDNDQTQKSGVIGVPCPHLSLQIFISLQ
jgi:hypothetical protein